MTRSFLLTLAFSALITCAYSQVTTIDDSWRFFRGDIKNAQLPEFDDSGWKTVDLPHDWSTEDIPGTGSPFDRNAVGQVSAGYTVGGTGWYRKSFTIPVSAKDDCVWLEFDGIYMNSDVWVNGQFLGNHPYGYTSFWYDITGVVTAGGENVIAVQVKNEGKNSRWYSGSGIYRHVRLKITGRLHIAQNGIRITTPEVSDRYAKVRIRTSVVNGSKVTREVRFVNILTDEAGKEIARQGSSGNISAGSSVTKEHFLEVKDPLLWSVDSPYLYTVVTEIYSGEKLLERRLTAAGIRSIAFTADRGFLLNGNPVKLRGGCMHHDNGPLGSRSFDRAEERKARLLKINGFNAVRCSHNPPSPAFLDACDRTGILVIDEAFDMWIRPNNPEDYHLYFDSCWERDIESFVLRDINHPSVIMWSIGNEIRDMESAEVIAVEKRLAAKVRSLDSTRPVTAAVNNLRPQKDEFFSHLDVCGYNYAAGGDHGQENIYLADHARKPRRIMYGSESYPEAAFSSWESALNNTFVLGDFVWTAIDYIGEASIGWCGYWQEDFFPWNLAWCGDIDICGWKRPQSFYRDALWKDDQISVFVKPPEPSFRENPNKQSWSKWGWQDVVDDWNWKGMEGKNFTAVVYTSCTEAELFINGRSLGRKMNGRENRYILEWTLPYEPGELKAVGYNGEKISAKSILRTAGEVNKISLTADRKELRADGQDLSYISVELTDDMGTRNPRAGNRISFSIEGNGTIAAVGNANPVSTESYQASYRNAWKGRCLVIVRTGKAPGRIILKASAEGLPPASVELKSSGQQ